MRGAKFVFAIAALIAAASFCGFASAQQSQNSAPPPTPDYSKAEVHILPVQGNIYMLVGAGGNITVQAGDDGVLLVDSGVAAMSDKVLEAIRPLSKRPLVYIINSDD